MYPLVANPSVYQTREPVEQYQASIGFQNGNLFYLFFTTTNHMINNAANSNSAIVIVQTNMPFKSQGSESHSPLWYEYNSKLEDIKKKLPLISIDYNLNLTEVEISKVIYLSKDILDKLLNANMAPLFITPTAEGGVLFRYMLGTDRHVFEVYPNLEIIYLHGKSEEIGNAIEINLSDFDDLTKLLKK